MTPPITTKEILLSDIDMDAGTQTRAGINEETVAQYAEDMQAGDKFPNPVVFDCGAPKYLPSDGFHRIKACERIGLGEVRCEIHKGARQDAIRYGLSANYSHGLRRSNADKRHAVTMALAEWPNLSDRELARICAVSHNFVSDSRKSQLSSDDSCKPSETRLGADGKTRKAPARKETDEEQADQPSYTTQEPEPSHITTLDQELKELAKLEIEPELTPLEQEVLDALDVQTENDRVIRDCIRGHSCDAGGIGEVILHCQTLAKVLRKYQASL